MNSAQQINHSKHSEKSLGTNNLIEDLKLNSFNDHIFSTNKTINKVQDDVLKDTVCYSSKNESSQSVHLIKRKKRLPEFPSSDLYNLCNETSEITSMSIQPPINVLSNYDNYRQYYLNEVDDIQCIRPINEKSEILKCGTNKVNVLSNVLIQSGTNIVEQMNFSKDAEESPNKKNQKKDLLKLNNFKDCLYSNSNISKIFLTDNILEDPFRFPSENESLEEVHSIQRKKYLPEFSNFDSQTPDFNSLSNEMSEIIPVQPTITVLSSCDNFREYQLNEISKTENLNRHEVETIFNPNEVNALSDTLGHSCSVNDDGYENKTAFIRTEEQKYINANDFETERKEEKEYDIPNQPQKNSPCNNFDEIQVVEPVETVKKYKNYADKLSYCFYCDKDVTHFTRHILTWHSTETTVQKMLSLPLKSKVRRDVISSLRKKGNFIKNRASDSLRPVKRLNSQDSSQLDDFLPCSYCLGFYKRKSLYRHTKKCPENTENRKSRQAAQSDGQTTLLMGKFLKCDQLLTKELFPRMRADKINLIAKKDMLICQYGYSYMKGRKSKGNIDFVRQNIRRLAKLLEFSRQQHPEIKDLIDILKPTHFSVILEGVNHIAHYNPETDMYESPTLALNFGTLLKKCCDLAYIHLLQIENTNDQRKDLKILKKLIESQWADEISAQASLNLHEKTWNKRELLPLTSDLKMLSIFLQKSADDASKELQVNEENYAAYNTLKEIVYTQIILLNRRRPAEAAQLKIDKYHIINNIYDGSENTEFEKCLSETEKILLNSYSRIVLRGKRGRGVPVLMSPDMKTHFDYFISIRNKFITDNKYVFHTNGQGCLDGTKTLYKYALKCGVDKPKSISATKLRKHLATITQLLQFSEKDLEQLSQFMGHTLKTHCKVYRLSDNMYQTAKVSKLLLLMSEGGIEQYKGKSLDDIDLDLTPVIEEDNIFNQIHSNEEDTEEEAQSGNVSVPVMRNRKPIIRHSWTREEKQLIAHHFCNHIKNRRAPNQAEVEELITMYPKNFKNRKWTTIKAVVFNIYTGKLKTNS